MIPPPGPGPVVTQHGTIQAKGGGKLRGSVRCGVLIRWCRSMWPHCPYSVGRRSTRPEPNRVAV